MLIIPAIDLKDGQCVRLKQGLMDDATVFSTSPGEQAAHWLEQGARRLHVVDLNGAFAGKQKNERVSKRSLTRWVTKFPSNWAAVFAISIPSNAFSIMG